MTRKPTYRDHAEIGDRLLADGWHARSIATPDRPGSRWILLDRDRRLQLTLACDLAGPYAELSAVHLPGAKHDAPLWRLIVHAAPPMTILGVARVAASKHFGNPDSPAAARRALAKDLRHQRWHANRRRWAQSAAATVTWSGPGTGNTVTWTAPGRRTSGGWEIKGEGLHVAAHPATPAPILRAIATA